LHHQELIVFFAELRDDIAAMEDEYLRGRIKAYDARKLRCDECIAKIRAGVWRPETEVLEAWRSDLEVQIADLSGWLRGNLHPRVFLAIAMQIEALEITRQEIAARIALSRN